LVTPRDATALDVDLSPTFCAMSLTIWAVDFDLEYVTFLDCVMGLRVCISR
jgi:hypothetical protein